MSENTFCPICQSHSIDLLWNLPNLPQSERYGKYAPNQCCNYDQELLRCNDCTHVFLKRQIDPKELYSWGSYKFRSEVSNTAKKRNQFFAEYWNELTEGNKIQHLIDVGGNDLYLMKLLEGDTISKRTVIDPIWAEDDRQEIDGIAIEGTTIEELDLTPEIDAVASSHTFEHLPNPRQTLEKLFKETAKDTLVLIEIPDWDSLVESLRFDCIFHQHYHYFSLSSLLKMIDLAGGHYVGHKYNKDGTCGGSLLVACRAGPGNSSSPKARSVSKKVLQDKINLFKFGMDTLREMIATNPTQVCGYGASLLLATFFYHLKPDFGKLRVIYDDDATKHETGYQNIPVQIIDPRSAPPTENSTFLITSLENQRTLYRRICEFDPKRLINYPIS